MHVVHCLFGSCHNYCRSQSSVEVFCRIFSISSHMLSWHTAAVYGVIISNFAALDDWVVFGSCLCAAAGFEGVYLTAVQVLGF